MAWRLAESLVVLRDQIDALAPNRGRHSDGTIGDRSHQERPSRHNPNDAEVVCALDVTDDPAGGCPIHEIADQIRANPHPDLAYVISNSRVAGRNTGWNWHRYTGTNPHDRHAHFGVGTGPEDEPTPPYDDTEPWQGVTGNGGNGGDVVPSTPRTLRRGMQGEDVRGLQTLLIGAGHLDPGSADGIFGPSTEAAVMSLQAELGLEPDGVVGPQTHGAIARLLVSLPAGGGEG
jgi:hypothetical protein